MLVFGGTAFGWDFTAPTLSFGTSYSSSFTSAPTGFGSATSFAGACSDCFTLNTSTWSTTTTYDGWNGSISTAGASAFVDTTECDDPDPEPCVDIDQDTLCDEFDNCLDTPPGDPIDDFGCPIPPEPCDDTDEDGVCDVEDECEDTPLDVTVDDFGCECEDTDLDGICDVDDECIDVNQNQICDDEECAPDDVQCILDVKCECGAPPPFHGDYQSCIVHWANELGLDSGIGTCYASIAADSDCGMPGPNGWQEGISEVPVYQEGECEVD